MLNLSIHKIKENSVNSPRYPSCIHFFPLFFLLWTSSDRSIIRNITWLGLGSSTDSIRIHRRVTRHRGVWIRSSSQPDTTHSWGDLGGTNSSHALHRWCKCWQIMNNFIGNDRKLFIKRNDLPYDKTFRKDKDAEWLPTCMICPNKFSATQRGIFYKSKQRQC